MKRTLSAACLFLSLTVGAQTADRYFEKIRNNSAALTAFFAQMPKGGDLHNHYSGSVYAETYVAYVIAKDYYINKKTLDVKEKAPEEKGNWASFSELKTQKLLPLYQQKLMQKWSVKDYNYVDYPSDKQFFETFPAFNIASSETQDEGLLELKHRAKLENLSYIETMFTSIRCSVSVTDLKGMNEVLRDAQAGRDKDRTVALLDSLYAIIQSRNVVACAKSFNRDVVDKLHYGLKMDDADFKIRYQNYVVRLMEPVDLFKNLITAFESADRDTLIVGVNIVAPEDGEVSMQDYWLHMQMFRYCHSKYPNVKYSMHAGELTLGLVKPEELSWHINAAVRTARACRIGHGVDLAYEKNPYDLLDYMREHDIPIEINLFSNEFILKVKDDRHPILLYKKYGVPILICTDDAGVLRTNLTDQYVLLAKRYREFSYQDIKDCVYNSIRYSFIENPQMKQQLLKKLDRDFMTFEKKIAAQ